jgi:hypothetical protein
VLDDGGTIITQDFDRYPVVRAVLRCSGRVNHQDPVMAPHLPGGKPGSGAPPGWKFFRSGLAGARPPGVLPGEIEPEGDLP